MEMTIFSQFLLNFVSVIFVTVNVTEFCYARGFLQKDKKLILSLIIQVVVLMILLYFKIFTDLVMALIFLDSIVNFLGGLFIGLSAKKLIKLKKNK